MDRIERIESPQPHERTWAVTPVRKRDPEKEREERREQKRREHEQAERPQRDDDEPPHLIDVVA
jgi:hypothetical protein